MKASHEVVEATIARNDRAAEYAEATYALEVAKAALKRAQQEHDDAVLLLTLADSQVHGAIAAAAGALKAALAPVRDPRVRLVRADHIVGRGTYSVAERYTDAELVEMWDFDGARTAAQALRSARRIHRDWVTACAECW